MRPRIIIAGAPASGKGTQCEYIKNYFKVVHLSTGDMLRDASNQRSKIGLLAKEYMNRGELVPDSVIIDVILQRLCDEDCRQNGWLLDGFPRTKAQALALQAANITCDIFILLNVPDSALIERVIGRRLDPVTGRIYHLKFSPPENEEIGNRLIQRDDDTEEKVKIRLRSFNSNMSQIIEVYDKQKVDIDGFRPPIHIWNEIAHRITRATTLSVIFIIGGPLTGKKTLAAVIGDKYSFVHLHISEVVQDYLQDSSDLPNKTDILEHEIPSDVLVSLLKEKIGSIHNNRIIIVDFPRNIQDLLIWFDRMGSSSKIEFLFHIVSSEEEVSSRINSLHISQGAFAKRSSQFASNSPPILKAMHSIGKLREISTSSSILISLNKMESYFTALKYIPPYERSAIIVKPDSVGNGHLPMIIRTITENHMNILALQFISMDEDCIDSFFYSQNEDISFFLSLKALLLSGLSVVMIVEGCDCIRRLSQLAGCNDPAIAKLNSPDSLRALFGKDTICNCCAVAENTTEAFHWVNFWMNTDYSKQKTSNENFVLNNIEPIVEDTLAIIKPSFSENVLSIILAIILGHGFQIVSTLQTTLPHDFVEDFYANLKNSQLLSRTKSYMLSGPVVALHLRREGAVRSLKHLIGTADFAKIKIERPDCIRTLFALDEIRNVIHGSDNVASSMNEISAIFPFISRTLKYDGKLIGKTIADSDSERVLREAMRRSKNNLPLPLLSMSRQSEMVKYITDEVNPVIKNLLEAIAIMRPKDVIGYAIKSLIEQQRATSEVLEKRNVVKLKPIIKKDSLKNGDQIKLEKAVDPSEVKSMFDEIYGNDFVDCFPSYNGKSLTLDLALSEIRRLRKALSTLNESILSEKNSDACQKIQPGVIITTNNETSPKNIRVLVIGGFTSFEAYVDDICVTNNLAKFVTFLQTIHQKNTLVIFGGNCFGPSRNYHEFHIASVIVLLNLLRVNCAMPGEHDLYYGYLALSMHMKKSEAIWLMSNISDKRTLKPVAGFENTAIITMNSLKVGVFALLAEQIMDKGALSSEQFIYTDVVETAQLMIQDLKNFGADIIIVLSSCQAEINEVICRLPSVTTVIASQGNQICYFTGKETSILEFNQHIGSVIEFTIKNANGHSSIDSYPCQLVMSTKEKEDSATLKLQDEIRNINLHNLSRKIGTFDTSFKSIGVLEYPLGNLVADIVLHSIEGTHLGIVNSSSINFRHDILPGCFTVETLLKMFPAKEYVTSIELTGQELKDFVELSLCTIPFPDCHFSKGVKIVYNPKNLNKKLVSMTIHNIPVDDKSMYKCAMPGHVAESLNLLKSGRGHRIPLVYCLYQYLQKRNLYESTDIHGTDLFNEDNFEPLKPQLEKRLISTEDIELLHKDFATGREGAEYVDVSPNDSVASLNPVVYQDDIACNSEMDDFVEVN